MDGELLALVTLGQVLAFAGFVDRAGEPIARAFALEQEHKNDYIKSGILLTLGVIEMNKNRPELAIEHFESSIEACRRAGEEFGEGSALRKLAEAYADLDRYEEAAEIFREATAHQRLIGHRQGEAASLWGLGAALQKLGQLEPARDAWQNALLIYEELGAPESAEIRVDLDGLFT